MRSIGGGTVRYVDVEFAPASDSERVVGETIRGGSIEIVVDGRVVETVSMRVGAEVYVRDGEAIDAGTMVAGENFARAIHADIERGLEARVHFVDASRFEERVDEVTGLSRLTVKPSDENRDAAIELRVESDRVLKRVELPDGANLLVRDGDLVRRGDVIARIVVMRARQMPFDGVESLRRFLDAKTPHRGVAPSAPFDGVIEGVEKRVVVLRATDGRVARIRVPRGAARIALIGERVRAGDPLFDGDRSHHRLLRAWGPQRLAEHMVYELDRESRARGMSVPRAYWSLVVRRMLAWRRVVKPGDTGLKRNAVLGADALARVQEETRACGGAEAEVVVVLRGVNASPPRSPSPRTRRTEAS